MEIGLDIRFIWPTLVDIEAVAIFDSMGLKRVICFLVGAIFAVSRCSDRRSAFLHPCMKNDMITI